MNDPDFSFGEMCVECVAYLDKAIPILSGVSSDLRTAPDKEALGKLGNFDEGLKWLTDFAAKSEIFLPDDGLKSAFASFLKEINSSASEFVEAVNNKDYVDLADVLEHQFVPTLDQFRSDVKALIPH